MLISRPQRWKTKPPPGTQINWAHPSTSDLVACYLLNEGAGTVLTDLASSLDGAFEDAPAWGIYGGGQPTVGAGAGLGLSFDGSNDAIDCGNPTQLQITDNITVECIYTFGGAPVTSYSLVSKDKDTGGRAFTLDLNSTPATRWYINGGALGNDILTSGIRTTNSIIHDVGVYRKSDKFIGLYGNGTLNTSKTADTSGIPSATAHVHIARREFSTSLAYFSGKIFLVRIWNRPLGANEIFELSREPYAMFIPRAYRRHIFFAPSVTIIPDPAILTLTTYAPVVTTPIVPFSATLRLTTFAPIVNIGASTPVITGSLLQVDWNDDGDFADTGEDVTARLISSQDMTVVRGKDQLRLLSPPMAGAFNCELDNRSRDYSAENAGSPLFDKLFPGHKVRVTLETAATNYTVFTGVLDGIPQHPEFGNYTVELPSLGSLSKLRGKKVSTELLENVKTGEAINAVLDAADWSADERTIDDGQTTLLQFWANEEDAFDLVVSLMLTDGPGASVYENELGWFIFEDRHSRVILDRCTTSQFTFTDQDYIIPDAYEYDPGIRDVINACEVAVTTRTEKEQQVIWQYSKPLILGADEVRTITAQFNDPCKEIQVPDPSGGLNEVQRLTVLGTAPLIRLSYNDQQTGDLSLVSAGASAIQTALENLSSIGSGNVSVIRVMVAPDAIAFNIEFLNDLARMPIELLGVSAVGGTGKPVEAKVTHSTVGAVDDYRLLAGSLASVTLSRTSGQSVDITLTAGASGAYVDGLQLRGRPVTTDSQKRIANELDASVSQGKYGVRSYSPASRPEISEEEALQLADNVVRYYEEPRPTLVFAVEGVDGTVQLQQLTRQISDRITIQEAQTGINADFFIERISHRITEGPIIHTQFGCEKVGNLSVSGGGGSLWDTAVWDSAVYGS